MEANKYVQLLLITTALVSTTFTCTPTSFRGSFVITIINSNSSSNIKVCQVPKWRKQSLIESWEFLSKQLALNWRRTKWTAFEVQRCPWTKLKNSNNLSALLIFNFNPACVVQPFYILLLHSKLESREKVLAEVWHTKNAHNSLQF